MSQPLKPNAVAFEEAEDLGSNPSHNPTMGDIIAERMSRRDLMRGMLAVSVAGSTLLENAFVDPAAAQTASAGATAAPFQFPELTVSIDARHHVADGYDADVLIRWGDKVLADAPAFVPGGLSSAGQERQFGYNNDFIGYVPLGGRSDHGLLVVNHEYANPELMFSGIGSRGREQGFPGVTAEICAIEMAAHGGSVIEIKRENGKWRVVEGSQYARRITANTPMRMSGPAAGHERLKTSDDPTGTQVFGMLNNCAGGMTPWGTWLTCEENFNGYFAPNGAADAQTPEGLALRRYGIKGEWYAWSKFINRFDVSKEPNEPNRFGWVVEIDPLDPTSMPVKRTAMGRFKHEGAGTIINKDGRFVAYQGDDERFDHVYRFVTEGKVNLTDRAANKDLLDRGTLSAAKFNADGTGEWLPLEHGSSPWLTDSFGFKDQAEILINARLAASMIGATRMDRPEDIEVNPRTGKAYLMLTNNSRRTAEGPQQVDAANPRVKNDFGHIIEITPADGDHAARTFRWEILLLCGDPTVAAVGATFNPMTSANGWFGMPDNCAIDADGRLWVATDGNKPSKTQRADGLWAVETEGPGRGTSRCFFQVPLGAELCGPCFTPDLETLFVAVQHPGEANDEGVVSTFDAPITRWPDFDPAIPPRPAVVAITRKGGGKIAS